MTSLRTTFTDVADVFRAAGLPNDESVISSEDALSSLEEVESWVFEQDIDRRVIYIIGETESETSGTASDGTTETLEDSTQAWDENEFEGYTLWIYGGTGAGQFTRITSNTTDTLSFDELATAPDDTSLYRIINDIRYSENYTGNGSDYLVLRHMDLKTIYSIANGDNSYTESNLRINYQSSELWAKDFRWDNTYPNNINIVYFAGIDPYLNKKNSYKYINDYIATLTAIKILAQQTGGTYNTPSSYSVPEGSITIGQAYVNIKGTVDQLQRRAEELRNRCIIKNPYFA